MVNSRALISRALTAAWLAATLGFCAARADIAPLPKPTPVAETPAEAPAEPAPQPQTDAAPAEAPRRGRRTAPAEARRPRTGGKDLGESGEKVAKNPLWLPVTPS